MTTRSARKMSIVGTIGLIVVGGFGLGRFAIGSGASATGEFPKVVEPPTLVAGTTIIHKMPGGITFRETNAPATLPDGRPVISRSQAIQVAEKQVNPGNEPGAQVMAVYGSYSDNQYGRVSPSGARQLYYQDRPAWLVRYEGVTLYAAGGNYYEFTHPDAWKQDVNHEQNVFIDAATGAFLGAITYR